MFGKKEKDQVNLLELVPERLFGYSQGEDELVTVDMPRFHVPWIRKFFEPRWKNPYIRIKLDAFGSYAWLLCDGTNSVNEVAEGLVKHFGEEIQPVHERLGTFFSQLRSRGFVRLRKPDGTEL